MELQYFQLECNEGEVLVNPLKTIFEEVDARWKECLVGYFIDETLPYRVVNSISHRIWDKLGLIEVLAIGNGFFLFRFESKEKCMQVMEMGP